MSRLSGLTRTAFGNIIEWYDFSLYIYFAVCLSTTFFPNYDSEAAKLLSFSTFFIGALVRPLGACLMGWVGDRFGLRWSINLCVIVMGVSTFSVALLPSYAMIGVWAPVLLVLLRILQGLSVGGQFPSLITLSVKEQSQQRGFAVGLIFAISTLGFWLASFVGFAVTSFLPNMSHPLVWRTPFALSGVLFLIYLFLNRAQSFAKQVSEGEKKKVLSSIRHGWRAMLAVVVLTTTIASLYMLLYTYLVNYRIEHLGVSPGSAFFLNSSVLLVAACAYPFFGYLADRLGFLRVFLWGAVLMAISIYPSMLFVGTASAMMTVFIMLFLTLLLAAMQGAISPLFASVFGGSWQATRCALGYSIGNGLSGGAPLIAEWAVQHAQHGLAILFVLLSLCGLLGLVLLRWAIKPVWTKAVVEGTLTA